MITLVITSCGRFDLLKRTIESFIKFNTYPVEEVIIIDDSENKVAHDKIRDLMCKTHIPMTLILNEINIGQISSIDRAYAEVKTKYLFHCEDDWEFYKPGFLEKSLIILENKPKILQVWLRAHYDTNTHPIEKELYEIHGVKYQIMQVNAIGGAWHGFTLNPGLRRLEDYNLVAPFTQYLKDGDFNALTECRIGQKYFELGFRSAILTEGYIKHIGYGQQIKH